MREVLVRAAGMVSRASFGSAASRIRALTETEERDPAAWAGLGDALLRQQRPADAVSAFRNAAILAPQSPDAWLGLGRSLAASGDAAGARRAFFRCLSIDLATAAERRGLADALTEFVLFGGYLPDLDPATMAPRHPGIFIASLPKSGTVFLQSALCKGLGKRPVAVPSGGLFPNVTIAQSAIERLHETGGIYVIHCAPSAYNRREIHHRLDRLVVHVRDPRQALLSWAHFLPQVIRNIDPVYRHHYELPADYDALPFPAQLDWQIEHHLPHIVAFIAGWTAFADDVACRTRVLFTTQEEMARDQDAFFRRLLSFHDIPESAFEFPEAPRVGSDNFRSGEVDEWREAFNPDQRERMVRAIPAQMRQR
ncbi:MAG: tetratricopeptide repeat protein, partial [Vicinamibacterales bacterium]